MLGVLHSYKVSRSPFLSTALLAAKNSRIPPLQIIANCSRLYTSETMWAVAVPLIGGVSFLVYFFIVPLFNYFRDVKGFRRYPNLNAIAGFTDLGFMWEAAQGFRSKKLYELHKAHPIIRIGPNSLSYGDVSAIKVKPLNFQIALD